MSDQLHLVDHSAGSRRMHKYLRRLTGKKIGRGRVRRLMRVMGVETVFPRKKESQFHVVRQVFLLID